MRAEVNRIGSARLSVKRSAVVALVPAASTRKSARRALRAVTPPAAVAEREANRQVVQNFVATRGDPALVATRDPADRAHGVRDDRGLLVPAALGKHPTRARPNQAVGHAAPRMYHESQVNGAGLAVDSQFDWLYEAQQRLEGVPGIGRGSANTSAITGESFMRALESYGVDSQTKYNIRNAMKYMEDRNTYIMDTE